MLEVLKRLAKKVHLLPSTHSLAYQRVSASHLSRLSPTSSLAVQYSVHPSAVAIRWLLHQSSVPSVVIGPRTVEQLEQNLEAAKVHLTPEEVAELSAASKVSTPYPANFTEEQNPTPAKP